VDMSLAPKMKSIFVEHPTYVEIESHLLRKGIKADLVRESGHEQITWSFSVSQQLSVILRLYRAGTEIFFATEIAFGIIDKSNSISKITKMMAIRNTEMFSLVRLGLYLHNDIWLCVAQTCFGCNHFNQNFLDEVLDEGIS